VVSLTILSPKVDLLGKAKIRLTTVSFSSILHSSILSVSNNPSSYFWRIYEKDFPERPHVKAPRGFRSSLWGLSSQPFLHCPFFIILNQIFKTKKEETIMATKKLMCVLFGILVIAAWVLGSVIQAGAETMKCKTSGIMVKIEGIPIPDVDGHRISLGLRDGLAFFEDGEVATFKASSTSDTIAGKEGRSQGYLLFSFVDGSTIITSFGQTSKPDPEGKFGSVSELTGEILKGTGRFEGIKGSLSGQGKQFKLEKGELAGKSTIYYTFTYTLPSK
jgi:hypothetical protein